MLSLWKFSAPRRRCQKNKKVDLMKKITHLEDMEQPLLELESVYSHSEIEAAAFRLCVERLSDDFFATPERVDDVKQYISDILML